MLSDVPIVIRKASRDITKARTVCLEYLHPLAAFISEVPLLLADVVVFSHSVNILWNPTCKFFKVKV